MKTHMLIQEPANDGTFKYVIYEYDEKYANKMGDAVKQIGNYMQCHLKMLELKYGI
jgi:hypothetical protein